MEFSGNIPVGLVWRDEGRNRDDACIGKQLGDFTNPSDVLIPVLLAETKVLIQTEPDVIPIESIGGFLQVKKVLFQSTSNGGLPATAQSSKP